MLDGWYCRSIAASEDAATAEEEEQIMEESKFRKEYKYLKRKFQNLIYENEAFQQALRSAQKRLLAITRDRSFLLDRLMMHEKLDQSSSESEETESSDEGEVVIKVEQPIPNKKKRIESNQVQNNSQHVNSGKAMPQTKRRRPPVKSRTAQHAMHLHMPSSAANVFSDGHMTPEEVERHLQSQSFLDLMPERAPPTVPTEMFSNEPSLDSESNDMIGEMETSPSNMEEEISIDMLPE